MSSLDFKRNGAEKITPTLKLTNQQDSLKKDASLRVNVPLAKNPVVVDHPVALFDKATCLRCKNITRRKSPATHNPRHPS